MIILKEFYFKDENSIGQLENQPQTEMSNNNAASIQIQQQM